MLCSPLPAPFEAAPSPFGPATLLGASPSSRGALMGFKEEAEGRCEAVASLREGWRLMLDDEVGSAVEARMGASCGVAGGVSVVLRV